MTEKTGKTALVLAGGGLAGVVYEIGALRAIDDLLVDRTVGDFDIYVGTSAGALVCAGLANGLSPEAMLRVLDGSHPEIKSLRRRDIFSLNATDFLRRSLALPRTLWGAASHYLRNLDDMTLFDMLWTLSELLPDGLYNGLALEEYVRRILTCDGRSNSFTDLDRALYIIATNLETGERAVFGAPDGVRDVPISLAVAASSAVPFVYKPVRIGESEFVDGGMRGTASLDVAIEQGATLVICINPLVPFDNSNRRELSYDGRAGGYLSEKGIQAIGAQITRILTHSGLRYHVKQLQRQHPMVDIILIEPRPHDQRMAFNNVMRYSMRMAVAQHGFESVTLDLAEDYAHYKAILARHGIPLSRRLVISELEQIQASGHDPQIIRQVLEARSAPCNPRRQDGVVCQLTRALAELDLALEGRKQGSAAGYWPSDQ